MKNTSNTMLRIGLLLGCCWASIMAHAEFIDGIVAIVENDIILSSELAQEAQAIIRHARAKNIPLPSAFIVRKQALEHLITLKLQYLLAQRSGITVPKDILKNELTDLAQSNNMSLPTFRKQLQAQGISYKKIENTVRDKIKIDYLKANTIGALIKVNEQEIDHFLETQDKLGVENIKYLLGHILLATPNKATADVVHLARIKAEHIVKELRSGKDFKQVVINQALTGKDLGWRSIAEVPTIFVAYIPKLLVGNTADPIHSPSGFHIIKMLAIKGVEKHIITQTKVRHILLKLNELVNDQEAQKSLLQIRKRISNGEDFAVLARTHSADKASSIKGGVLGGDPNWINPGALTQRFEEAMNKLAINEISEPIQTQFGWHIIQVLDRQEINNSKTFMRNRVRMQIRKRKIEEQTQLWLRQLRDDAFVVIHQDRL